MDSSRAEFAEAILALLFYVLYRLLRALIQLESDAYVLLQKALLRYQTGKELGGDQLEVSTIFARKRFHLTDLARDVDFLAFFDHWESVECLEDPRWMLYSVTRTHAYFVKMPNSSIEFAVDDSPFLGTTMFELANKVARLPVEHFVEQSHAYRNFKGKVIVISTMARSGSTLMAKMLQATDHSRRDILVLSEPDVFSVLATMIDDFAGVDLRGGRQLLLATTRFICKDQLRDQTIVLKMNSAKTILALGIHHFDPNGHFLINDLAPNDLVACFKSLKNEQGFRQ
uniref:Sulfotransfer_1 domain-containing protein n=1 Tax=Steinernema glaseri TaxID=37863 RepID=A0A1I7ZQW7_9BILA